MSLRGLRFAQRWAEEHIDPSWNLPYWDKRVQVLAAACRLDARSERIGLQEIQDEIGDLEEAIARMLVTRETGFFWRNGSKAE
jgi:hypothetical protein